MPYVPGFAHDVFVSYAHGPKPLAGFRGMRSDFISKWTQSLVDDLSSQLDVFLGTKDQKRRVSIWMDPALDGNYPLSENINAKIKQSALLLVVMSDFYLDSPWCLPVLRKRSIEEELKRGIIVRRQSTINEQARRLICDNFD